jgi:uncharacterized protein (TIGR03437 family)
MSCRCVVFLLTCAAAIPMNGQTLPALSLTPTTVNFSYQIGTTQLPAAQSVAVKRSGSGDALNFTVTVSPPAPWLIVTPAQGKTGTSVSLRVNPTSLVAGTYLTTIQVDAQGSSGPVSASVVLLIKNPPPAMSAAPATLAFTYKTDDVGPPAPQTISVTTSGEPFSFSAAATGGTWLTITPSIGVVLSGSPVTITASVDTTGLVPGAYTGKITLTSTTAANKSITINVALTVNPGAAVLSSIWPSAAPVGSLDTTITIRGTHLFRASVVKANTTDLTATWISTGALLAVIPKALLSTQGTLNITVTNSPQPPSNQQAFTVTPPGPTIQTVLNAASFAAPGATLRLAPGEIISVFGSGLGPSTALMATPTNNAFPTTLGTPAALVEFELAPNTWTPSPLIFVQANQINAQTPFAMTPATGLRMRVTYNNLASTPVTFDAVAADPGLFTIDSSGKGQAAALNYATATQAYSLNSSSNPVTKGDVLVLYLTGGGAITPAPNPEGQLSGTNPLPALAGTASVTIGGEAASVISATAVPGALGGLIQLNVSVPTSLKAGKDLPVVVVISGRATPATATVAVK